jgi:hypothetical protein
MPWLVTLVLAASRVAAESEPDYLSLASTTVRIHVTGVDENQNPVDNWGTGFFIDRSGFILTAFHVVGRHSDGRIVKWKSLGPDEEGKPNITFERWGQYKTLEPIQGTEAFIDVFDKELDIVRLRLAGSGYPSVQCHTQNLKENSHLWALGWRKDRTTYDPLGVGTLAAFDLQDKKRRRLVNMAANHGNSGGPVFDKAGVVVAIITSGRNEILDPGSKETFVTLLRDIPSDWLRGDGGCLMQGDGSHDTRENLVIEGMVKALSGSPLAAEITGIWKGTASPVVQIRAGADGHFRAELPRRASADEFQLHVSYEMFQDETINLHLSRVGEIFPRVAEITLKPLAAPVPSDLPVDGAGRTLYFLPYNISGTVGTDVAETLNNTMPDHIKYGIVTKLRPYYRRDISVENLNKRDDLSKAIAGLTAANTYRLRELGERLNALGIITGRGVTKHSPSGTPMVQLLSEYILPSSVNLLPADIYVEDVIGQTDVFDLALGANLNNTWAHRTLLVLAEKELRTRSASKNEILAYLKAARRSAAAIEVDEIDEMIVRVETSP